MNPSGFRASLRLPPDEKDLLKHLYLQFGIPRDQYDRRPMDLRRFTREWNALSGRHDSGPELIHYIRTQQKQKLWVTFDGNHQQQPFVELPALADHQWATFNDIYLNINIASDNYSYDLGLVKRFIATFAGRTGCNLSPRELLIALIDRRKDGLLPRLEKPFDPGFRDLDDAEDLE
jgi:hypothetical protein